MSNRLHVIVLGAVLFGMLFSGCAMTKYERTVTVKRDASGAIISTEEVEHSVQTGTRKNLPNFYVYEKGVAK